MPVLGLLLVGSEVNCPQAGNSSVGAAGGDPHHSGHSEDKRDQPSSRAPTIYTLCQIKSFIYENK